MRTSCMLLALLHCHSVCSIVQFHRVLTELELGGLMSEMEFAIIYRQFGVRVGGRTDINYSLFCAMIEGYALTRWTDPALK